MSELLTGTGAMRLGEISEVRIMYAGKKGAKLDLRVVRVVRKSSSRRYFQVSNYVPDCVRYFYMYCLRIQINPEKELSPFPHIN